MGTADQGTGARRTLRLLRRGRGGRPMDEVWVTRGVQHSQALILQKLFCPSRGAGVTRKGPGPSLDMSRCGDWCHEISS